MHVPIKILPQGSTIELAVMASRNVISVAVGSKSDWYPGGEEMISKYVFHVYK